MKNLSWPARPARRLWVLIAALPLLACAAGALFAAGWLGRGLNTLGGPRPAPVIVRAGSLGLSFEVTGNPFCSPLTTGCPAMPPLYSARYFTVWVALTTPTPNGLTMISRRLVMLQVD